LPGRADRPDGATHRADVAARYSVFAAAAAKRIHSHFFIQPKGFVVGVKKTGRGRRKLGRKKRRMRSRIRHRKK
jgi:hypothetical protein